MANFGGFLFEFENARRQALECVSRDDIIFPLINTRKPGVGHVRVVGPKGPFSMS